MAALALTDWRALRADGVQGTLCLERPGMQLDLGGIAKGYAAERGREVLRQMGIRSGLVQVGGSVATLGLRPDGQRWAVAIQHPRRDDEFLAILHVGEGLVDTAGDYQRFFVHEERRYHHILDPVTGSPARGVSSVTVLAGGSAPVDALATAALVMGMQEGADFLVRQGVSAVLVNDSGEVVLTPDLVGHVEINQEAWP